MYLFLTALDLHCCVRAFSRCREQGEMTGYIQTSEVTAWMLITPPLLTTTFQTVLGIRKAATQSYKMLRCSKLYNSVGCY